MENKLTIWALYDDGARSYYHALKDVANVISIGINDLNEPNYERIDLSVINPNLIRQLSKLAKPDIILASPPCESWSIADNQRRNLKDCYKEDDEMVIRLRNYSFYEKNNKKCPKCMKRDFFSANRTRLLGESTAIGLFQIIEHFKPKVWVIENPQTSNLWNYLNCYFKIPLLQISKYLAYYNCYDDTFTKKPTYFACNLHLELKHFHIKQYKKWEEVSGYDVRSSIPKKLILDIFNQIKMELNSKC